MNRGAAGSGVRESLALARAARDIIRIMDGCLRSLRDEFHKRCSELGERWELHLAPRHDGTAHVEFVNGLYQYVVTDRGSELKRLPTDDEDEILYWLMSDVVWDLACKFELENRVPNRDFRRLMFAKEIELMQRLDSRWAEKTKQNIADILKEHPYNDALGR